MKATAMTNTKKKGRNIKEIEIWQIHKINPK